MDDNYAPEKTVSPPAGSDDEVSGPKTQSEADDEILRSLGKTPVLKRNFGLISTIGFACSLLVTWEGVLLVFSINFANGGFAGSVYGYLIVWLGTFASFISMGELASMAPTAGGQYHWVSILGPKDWRKFLSYVVGWLTVMGWAATVASACYLAATLIQGLTVVNDLSYTPQPWQLVLLYWATLALAVAVNIFISWILPSIENFILLLHICGFIAILIPLVYFAPHGQASVVFTSFMNGGNWPTQGLSFVVGMLGPAYSLLGADGAVHMSEEISNPTINVPRAIILGIALNGFFGLSMLLACLFGIGDPTTILATDTGFPFIAIFLQAVGQVGCLTMTAIVTILDIGAAISITASASRMTWSFARDRGLPGWRWLSHVSNRKSIPIWSIIITAIFTFLLSLITLGSSLAFNDIVSLTISGFYSSYLIGNSLLLYRRLRGDIKPWSRGQDKLRNTMDSEYLTWGPWKLPEPLGTIVNAFSVAYLFVILFFSFWPTAVDPGVAGMNYSSLVTGGVGIFSLAYYWLWGHKSYKGPLIEVVG